MKKVTGGEQGYRETCEMTWQVVSAWSIFHGEPRFAFPPPEVCLIATLPEVRKWLARNDSARELCDELSRETERRELASEPTALMIHATLMRAGLEIERVPMEELLSLMKMKPEPGRN